MTDWLDSIKKSISKEIDEYERGKATLSEDEINETMPKVIEFYNNQPEDTDVYRDKNGCILLIQTPKPFYNKDKEQINKPVKYDSEYSDEPQYLLKDCKFRCDGETKTLSIFAEKDQWGQMGNVFNKKAFIKVPNLRIKYTRAGEKEKPMIELVFLKKYELDDIEEVKDEVYIFYGCNISQVISCEDV